MAKKRSSRAAGQAPPSSPARKTEPARARLPAWIRTWLPLAAFMAAGLWFRLSVTMWTPIIHPDSMQYMRLAKEIRNGEFFSRDYSLDQGFIKSRRLPPLYAFLIAPFANTQADLEKVGITISLILSTLTFIPFFFAARIAFSERAALIAAALFTFNNFAIWWAYPILTEPLFTFLFAAEMCLSLLALTRPRLWNFVAAGVGGALLYMTRDVGITAAPLIAVAAGFKFLVLDRERWPAAAKRVAALAAAFLVTAAPYFIHIRARTGGWGLSAQMDNTSITRQIRAVGGDRWDRDQEGGEQIRYLGEETAGAKTGLIGMVPPLAAKVVRNLWKYGLELVQRMNMFMLPWLALAPWAMARDYRRTRDRPRLLLRILILAWAAQLWALYALVTPYMVDERYMYPLCPAYLMLAGFGVEAAFGWARAGGAAGTKPGRTQLAAALAADFALATAIGGVSAEVLELPPAAIMAVTGPLGAAAGWLTARRLAGRGRAPLLSFTLPLAVVLYFLLQPVLVHEQVIRFFNRVYDNVNLILIYSYVGAGTLFAFALAPAGGYLARRAREKGYGPGAVIAAGAAALVLAVAGMMLFPLGSMSHVPLLMLAGMGLAMFMTAPAAADGDGAVGPRFYAAAAALVVAASFISQLPDYMDLRERVATVSNKYTAGSREAAADIKSKNLIPPNKVFISRKPFLAFYLEGDWYFDRKTGESLPLEPDELMALIRSGKIDYLAADSFTLKSLRTRFAPLAYAMRPLPGARLIYSRYFSQFGRVISVYDLRQEETALAPGTAEEHFERARLYYRQAALPFALREVEAVIAQDPRHREVWRMKAEILMIYYKTADVYTNPTLTFFPDLLPALVEAAQMNAELAPDDPKAAETLARVKKIAREEHEELEKRRREKLEGREK